MNTDTNAIGNIVIIAVIVAVLAILWLPIGGSNTPCASGKYIYEAPSVIEWEPEGCTLPDYMLPLEGR